MKSKPPVRRVPRRIKKKSFWTDERKIGVTVLAVVVVGLIILAVSYVR